MSGGCWKKNCRQCETGVYAPTVEALPIEGHAEPAQADTGGHIESGAEQQDHGDEEQNGRDGHEESPVDAESQQTACPKVSSEDWWHVAQVALFHLANGENDRASRLLKATLGMENPV